uniref:NADH:ubiquinone reductase (H(+)-translocating) n=1 Tax=Rhigonema thysanophora TaxID=435730 RepID=X2CU36_9BILA|nr:NADH dehydrogenase subunit 5 [Rhigonema thysanophora]AGZ90409.1 NADH dehydrogenase subunit 5 [Rhigonema thysanophora]
MFFLSLAGGLVFCSLLFWGSYFVFSFYLVEWSFVSYKISYLFNWCFFSFILLLVTLSVMIFSSYYLAGELNFIYYYFMLVVFVGSMFSLNYSSNGFSMLMSWDLLGISSFFLVLFYNNWDSCSGAMNTVLTNRVGDFFIFVFFSGVVYSGAYFLSLSYFFIFVPVWLMLAAFTKSAQFPFSGWLPKAMSAPTPVSSLVHSSTLVTAGLILILNFGEILFYLNISFLLLFSGVFTMCFSSLAALVEEDMKKVVALSTLSQMGFAMTTVGLGLNFVSFIHLLSHALFKSCLFMQVGLIIHCSMGQQDGRGYSGLGGLPYLIQLQLLVTLFCLCGLIFSSGAVSKDFILEFFFSGGSGLVLSGFFFFSIFLTFGYSYRLWKGFFLSFNKGVLFSHGSKLMNFLSGVLVLFSVMYLWWLNSNLLCVPSLYLYSDFFVPLFYVFVLLFLSFFVWKLLLKEFVYKFIVDFVAKMGAKTLVFSGFSDLLLNSFNSKGYYFLSGGGIFSGGLMKNLGFSPLVFIFLLIFLML